MKTRLLLFILVMPWLAVTAQAEDLGTIDVTASRMEAPSLTSSKPVTIITRQDIEASHAGIIELLRGRANITVRDTTGVGAKSQLDLGGFGEASSANMVVLIDGRRINSPDLSGVDWTQIPADQIERIEIVHGGSAVLYGDGAIGGVINIITRIPESGGKIRLSGGSFNTFTGSGRVGADSDRTRVEANLSAHTTDGYRVNSFFERFDGGARAEVDLPHNIGLRVSGNHHRDRAGLPGALTTAEVAADRKQAKNPKDFSRTTDGYADIGINWASDFGLTLDIDGGFRRRDAHSQFSVSTSDAIIRTRSLRPRLSYETKIIADLHLLAGADIDVSDGHFAFAGLFPLPTTFIERTRQGYYGLLQLGGMDQRWVITAGLRSEKIEDVFRQATTSSAANRKIAWEAGASLEILDGLRLRLNISQSLRFPLIDERYSFFTGAVDTALLPQTGRHYSGSLRYDWAQAWIEATISRADLDNEIFFNPLTFTNANYSNATRHDVVLLAAYWRARNWLQLRANYTYTDATFRGGVFAGNTIPAVPRHRFGAKWQADWIKGLNTSLSLTYVGESFLVSDQTNARPPLASYWVADASASYRWQDAELFLRVDNLNNRKYSTYGVFSSFTGSDNFYPAPEIAFRAGVSYRF